MQALICMCGVITMLSSLPPFSTDVKNNASVALDQLNSEVHHSQDGLCVNPCPSIGIVDLYISLKGKLVGYGADGPDHSRINRRRSILMAGGRGTQPPAQQEGVQVLLDHQTEGCRKRGASCPRCSCVATHPTSPHERLARPTYKRGVVAWRNSKGAVALGGNVWATVSYGGIRQRARVQ
jgi:hypothetical protein